MSIHKEIRFEDEICDYLAAHGWNFAKGDHELYDRKRALFPPDVLAWVQTAHFFAELHDAEHKKVFDSVIVVSDRNAA